jgi:tetratricopeptide (TPR) repeat protein
MAIVSLQVLYDQSRHFLEQNDAERAIAVAQHILRHFPKTIETQRLLGEAYLASRHFDQAQAAFQKVLDSDPENIPAHVGQGITYERQNRLDLAISEFEQALEVRPDMAELRNQLLRLYTEAWGSESAMLRLSRPGLARLYAKGHMLPQAIQEFRSVLTDHPDRFDAWVGLAEALWRDGQEDAAIAECYNILDQKSEVLKANLLLGYLKLAAGDPDGEHYWKIAQQIDPFQTVARALFETMPAFDDPVTTLSEWNEAIWHDQRTYEEPADHLQVQDEWRTQEEPVSVSSTAANQGDDFFSASWMDAVEQTQPAVSHTEGKPHQSSPDDNAFLASLLAFEGLDEHDLVEEYDQTTPAIDDLDDSVDIKPFHFESLEVLNESQDLRNRRDTPAMGLEAATMASDDEPESMLEDLGLGTDTIATRDAGNHADAPAGTSQTPAQGPKPSMSADSDVEPELSPFSLEDLGLSADEIASLDEPGGIDEQTSNAASNDLTFKVDPFDWSSDTATAKNTSDVSDAAKEQTNLPDADEGELLSDLRPFSLDDLDLMANPENTLDLETGSLPPALQPFSLDDIGDTPRPSNEARAPVLPAQPDDEEINSEPGIYSWQQPTSKTGTDFRRQANEGETSDRSIFAKLKQRREEMPPEEIEALPPVSLDADDEFLALFSEDNVSLHDDDTEAMGAVTDDMSLPSDQLGANERRAIPGDEPNLNPFSLEELGLSPEEIAALEQTQIEEHTFVEPEVATPEQSPPPQPVVSESSLASDETDMRPFSLKELGLSPEEVASLGLEESTAMPENPKAQSSSADNIPDLTSDFEPASLEPFDGTKTFETPVSREDSSDEPDLTPFSLAELGLSAEEIASLDLQATNTKAQADEAANVSGLDDADIQPFSLDDLDLPEDAVFNFSSTDAGDTVNRELGLTDDELDSLDLGELETSSGAKTSSDASELQTDQKDVTGDLALDHLITLGQQQGFVDLTDIISVVDNPEVEAERIEEIGWVLHRAGIEIRDGDEVIDMEAEETEEYHQESLSGGAIDTPQPSADDEPDLTPFTLGELGLTAEEIAALGLAGTSTTTGSEELGVEATAMPSQPESSKPELFEEPTASTSNQEPDLTPFTLAELGLTSEEIAALGLDQAGATDAPAHPAVSESVETPSEEAQPPSSEVSEALPSLPEAKSDGDDESELAPFSLKDLGLSDEEIAALDAMGTSSDSTTRQGSTPSISITENDLFDFSVLDQQPDEQRGSIQRTQPRLQEEAPPTSPEDAAFVPEPLDALDDIWHDSANALPTPTASVADATPAPEESSGSAIPTEPVLPPIEPVRSEPTLAAMPKGEEPARPVERPTLSATPPQREEPARPVERPTPTPKPSRPATTRHTSPTEHIPTGDESLDGYLRQLEMEPNNYGLSLSIARIGSQTGRSDLAIQQYKRLIKDNELIDQIVDDLHEMIDETEDPQLLRQMYRLLGDAYSRQNRFREAVDAYSHTFSHKSD